MKRNLPFSRRRLRVFLAAALAAFFLAAAAGRFGRVREPVPERFSRLLMGTVCELAFYPPPGSAPEALAGEVFEYLASLEARWSVFDPGSELSALNRDGVLENASAETMLLLRESLRAARLSGGAFDPTVKPLVDAWRAAEGTGEIPDRAGLLALVGYEALSLEGGRAAFARPGMAFDPGGIAKGLAADLAAGRLKDLGVSAGLVNLGGDIRVFGPGPRRSPWRVGIAGPRGEGVLGVIRLVSGGIATSGDYHRYFEVGGRRYSHILDPRTGYLADPPRSVTVVAPEAVTADALATAAAVLGAGAVALVEPLEGVELFLVDADGGEHRTTGFAALAGP